MASETLDLGEGAERMTNDAVRRPCSGECGKTWDEAGGGWVYFGTPPRWYCNDCDERVNGPIVKGPPEP